MGQVVTAEKIHQARDFYKLHFGYDLFNEEGQCNIMLKSNCFGIPFELLCNPQGRGSQGVRT